MNNDGPSLEKDGSVVSGGLLVSYVLYGHSKFVPVAGWEINGPFNDKEGGRSALQGGIQQEAGKGERQFANEISHPNDQLYSNTRRGEKRSVNPV